MSEDLHKRLIAAGLGQAQAVVYVALSALGDAGAADIARQARLPRATTYGALEALAQAGLVSVTYSGRRKRFIAAPPQALLELPKRQETLLRSLIPELLGMRKQSQLRPQVAVHDGIAGIIRVNEALLQARGSYRYIGSAQEMVEAMGKTYLEDYVRRRIERRIQVQAIRVRGHESDLACLGDGKRWLREVRWLERPVDTGVGTIYLWDGRIGMVSTAEEPFAMIIESRELSAVMDCMFTGLWNLAQPAARR
jgi:DNA-binding IclR family transcriptional regulator